MSRAAMIGTLPARPILDKIDEWIAKFDSEHDAPNLTKGVYMVAMKVGCHPRRIEVLYGQKTMTFDLADRIFQKLEISWYTDPELYALYSTTPLSEKSRAGEKKPKKVKRVPAGPRYHTRAKQFASDMDVLEDVA